jgi:hypothetical protein
MKITPLTDSFTPSEAQIKYVTAMVDLDVRKTRAALARAAGVDGVEIERWYSSAAFGTWLAKAVERQLVEKVADVWSSVYRKATDPRDSEAFEAAKEYLERFDSRPRRALP